MHLTEEPGPSGRPLEHPELSFLSEFGSGRLESGPERLPTPPVIDERTRNEEKK